MADHAAATGSPPAREEQDLGDAFVFRRAVPTARGKLAASGMR